MNVITGDGVPIKAWLDDIEPGALAQARNLATLPFAFRWIALMPDCHQGFGMPIGGVLTTDGMVIPNAVGVDIGCGMAAVRTSLTAMDIETRKRIMGAIRQQVPVGFNHHRTAQDWDGFDRAPDLPVIQRELASARRQLGTLGGGNHFIELQQGDDGRVWIMLHSGSRNFGLQVARTYHARAQELCARWCSALPDRDLAFMPADSPDGREYLAAMEYCLDFAQANRQLMLQRIIAIVREATGAATDAAVNIHHNYAARETHYGHEVLVHRKGATRATAGLRGIIPGSMGTASYIVEGLGNPESFMSCSHGAGRRMGRKEATRTLDMRAEQEKLAGIVHGLRTPADLEEAPGAYKDIDAVMAQQRDLVRIAVRLTPLAVVKG